MRISDWSSDVCSSDLKGFERWLGKKRMSGPRNTIIAFFIKRLLVDARQQCWIRAQSQIDMTCMQSRGHYLPTQSESAEARPWRFIPHCVIKRYPHDNLSAIKDSYP